VLDGTLSYLKLMEKFFLAHARKDGPVMTKHEVVGCLLKMN
jgi:hypothetical protein